jgi:DNA primase large subunit
LRALKKAIEERKIRDAKDQEITSLKSMQVQFQKKKERQTQAIEIHSFYHKYLEGLLEGSNEFADVKDIISRFDTLHAANQELLVRAQTAQEKIESDRISFTNNTQVFITN